MTQDEALAALFSDITNYIDVKFANMRADLSPQEVSQTLIELFNDVQMQNYIGSEFLDQKTFRGFVHYLSGILASQSYVVSDNLITESATTALSARQGVILNNKITQGGIPSGGIINQVIKKNTNSDYDFSWQDEQDISGKESLGNKIIAWGTPTDEEYPSAKLVHDSIDAIDSSKWQNVAIFDDIHPRWDDDTLIGTDRFNFKALPGGKTDDSGTPFNLGFNAIFWSSTASTINSAFPLIYEKDVTGGELILGSGHDQDRVNGYSIRLVRLATTIELSYPDGTILKNTFTDYDGNIYSGCKIGTQIWTRENLRVTHKAGGSVIATGLNSTDWFNNKSGSYTVQDFTGLFATQQDGVNAYGLLYNYYAVSGLIIDANWSVPSEANFQTLITYLDSISGVNSSNNALSLQSYYQINTTFDPNHIEPKNGKHIDASIIDNLPVEDLSGLVPKATTINSHALTGNVILNTDDIAESGTPTNKWFTNARAIGSLLTGFVGGAGTVGNSDTILQAIQKLSGNISAQDTALNLKVDKVTGLSLYSDSLADARAALRYTDAEKSKLAGLDSNHFRGKFASETLLNAVTGISGDYAAVDLGVGYDVVGYIWDDNDNKWVKQLGVSTAETPASIKSKYESNADTNAFTDVLKANLTTAYNWVTTNGSNVLAHITSTLNPHNVTKTQVGLSNVPDVDATVAANITQDSTHRFTNDTDVTRLANTIGTNTGDNATNSQYSSDYRAANFVAGTNYLAPTGSGAALTGITASLVGAYTTAQVDTIASGKVDKVAGSRLITSAESTLLGNTSGVNTGDQTLIGLGGEPAISKSVGLLSWNGSAWAWVTNNFLSKTTLITTANVETAVIDMHVHANKSAIDLVSGTNTGDETATTTGARINAAASATPNDSDLVATALSGGVLQKISWTNVKAFIKTYFDTIYTTNPAVATQISTALSGVYGPLSGGNSWVGNQNVQGNITTIETLGTENAPSTFNITSDWPTTTGWATTSGQLDHNGAYTTSITATGGTAPVIGNIYKLVITIGVSPTTTTFVGNVTIAFGGLSSPAISAINTYTFYYYASSTTKITLTPSSTTSRFGISALSIKQVTNASVTSLNDLVIGGRMVTPNGSIIAYIPPSGAIAFPQGFSTSGTATFSAGTSISASGSISGRQLSTTVQTSATTTGAITWTLSSGGFMSLTTALTGAVTMNMTVSTAGAKSMLMFIQGSTAQTVTLSMSGVTFNQVGTTSTGTNTYAVQQIGNINQYYEIQLDWISSTLCYVTVFHSPGSDSETAASIGSLINGASAATPNDSDLVATAVSAGSLVKITWTNVVTYLRTKLDSVYSKMPYGIALSDNGANATDITTGVKLTHTCTQAFTLSDVRGSLQTVCTGSTFIVDIKKNTTSIFSTKLSFNASQTTTVTASTPYVFTGTISFAVGDIIEFSVYQVGSVTAGRGLILFLTTI